jgi:hypothetical protein
MERRDGGREKTKTLFISLIPSFLPCLFIAGADG